MPLELVSASNQRSLAILCRGFTNQGPDLGGANAHVILDSAASFKAHALALHPIGVPVPSVTSLEKPFLLVLSAATAESLDDMVLQHKVYAETNPSQLKDIAYTLCNRRRHLPYRSFCITKTSMAMEFSPQVKSASPPKLTMVFTGQGAQWAGMARELIADFPSFSQDLDQMNLYLAGLDSSHIWDVKEELLKDNEHSQLGDPIYAQALATIVQVAVVNLLQIWGISPAAVVGHSSGEIAAAYAAGSITSQEALRIALYRGKVVSELSRPGSMAAVGVGRLDLDKYLCDGVVVACENSPTSVTLSGDSAALDAVLASVSKDMPDVLIRRLKLSVAYHSRKDWFLRIL
jgi:acyl transferase domain-containing protein